MSVCVCARVCVRVCVCVYTCVRTSFLVCKCAVEFEIASGHSSQSLWLSLP